MENLSEADIISELGNCFRLELSGLHVSTFLVGGTHVNFIQNMHEYVNSANEKSLVILLNKYHLWRCDDGTDPAAAWWIKIFLLEIKWETLNN